MRRPDLREEALAVAMLAAELQGEDLELSIESETGFKEAAAAVLAAIREAETMRDAVTERVKALEVRSDAFDARARRLRDVLMGALATAGQKSLPLPEATLTVVEQPATAVVFDENAVPLDLWRTKTTRGIDYRALAARLKAGELIPGATLNNQPPRLQVRIR